MTSYFEYRNRTRKRLIFEQNNPKLEIRSISPGFPESRKHVRGGFRLEQDISQYKLYACQFLTPPRSDVARRELPLTSYDRI